MTTYVYVCAAGHSGSTLLDLVLGSHSQAASLGELIQLPKNIALNTQCTCGEPVRTCKTWSAVIHRLSRKLGVDLLEHPYALQMGYGLASSVVDHEHQTRAYLLRRKLIIGLLHAELRYGRSLNGPSGRLMAQAVDNTVSVYDAVGDISGVEAVVDSSKSYIKAVSLYLRAPQRTRILLLTRDGRGVMWSNIRRGDSGAAAVRAWSNRYQRALPLLARHVLPEHRMHVRYEDLARDPPATLLRICDHIGLPYEASMLNYRQKVHHIVNGNRMRLSSDSTIRLDEDWRRSLPATDLEYFEKAAGRLNRSFGYA
jgi:hypothetical protein